VRYKKITPVVTLAGIEFEEIARRGHNAAFKFTGHRHVPLAASETENYIGTLA
jgi:hypothetical protein